MLPLYHQVGTTHQLRVAPSITPRECNLEGALSRSVSKDDHIRQSQAKRNAKRLHGPERGTPPPLAQVAHSTRVNMRYPSKVRLGPAA